MMGVLRYKIISDLWGHKGRTLQIVLIIGFGAAAIGMILGTRNMVIPMMQEMWQSLDAPSIFLFVAPNVSESEMEVLQRTEGVSEIEGIHSATIEWRVNPEDDWKQGGLNARVDYADQRLNRLELVEGKWPEDEVILVGQDAEEYFGISKHGKVYFKIDDKETEVKLDGMIYNMFTQPAYFGGTAQFYSSGEYFEKLVGNRDYNQIYVLDDNPVHDEEYTTEIANRVQDKIEQQRKEVVGRLIADPKEHFFQNPMEVIFMLLGVLGGLSLLLGLMLVYNTINAFISQQVDQIGIMKAIGGRTTQIFRLYFFTVLAYGLLAACIAIPIGILGGWGITYWLITSFGADPGEFQFSRLSLEVMVLIAVIAPILAAFIPVRTGSRITVREAISTYGLSTKSSFLERFLASAQQISRLVIITIGNTFRKKGRVARLEIALIVSGFMFMMVVSVRDSVIYTIRDVLFEILDADITMTFDQPYRIDYLQEVSLAHPEVSQAEMWGFTAGKVRPGSQEETEDDEEITLFGVPLPTDLYGYQLRKGRWLSPEDDFAIVLNQKHASDVGVDVGDWVTVKYAEKEERDWLVVGLVFDPILTTVAMVPRDVLLQDIGQVGKSGAVWMKTKTQDAEAQIATAKDLREYYKKNNIDVSAQRGVFGGFGGDATVETSRTFINQFNFVLILLGIMAIVIATVGSIALSGALSLSVLERRREIGVMRAIGASSWTIFRMFIGEGLILGWLSWLIALPLSVPASKLMVYALGQAFEFEMVYKFTFTGAIMWFFIITILSILASWIPAQGATTISVRESLAYQ